MSSVSENGCKALAARALNSGSVTSEPRYAPRIPPAVASYRHAWMSELRPPPVGPLIITPLRRARTGSRARTASARLGSPRDPSAIPSANPRLLGRRSPGAARESWPDLESEYLGNLVLATAAVVAVTGQGRACHEAGEVHADGIAADWARPDEAVLVDVAGRAPAQQCVDDVGAELTRLGRELPQTST